jgi:hypothetical protein
MSNTATKRVELRATPDWVERTTTRATARGWSVSEALRAGADLLLDPEMEKVLETLGEAKQMMSSSEAIELQQRHHDAAIRVSAYLEELFAQHRQQPLSFETKGTQHDRRPAT